MLRPFSPLCAVLAGLPDRDAPPRPRRRWVGAARRACAPRRGLFAALLAAAAILAGVAAAGVGATEEPAAPVPAPPATAPLPAAAPAPPRPFTVAPADPEAAPLWLRYPALSPDGQTIAFAFRGHLFTVPAAGGRAQPLTTGRGHELAPVWSPDGRQLAFASDRYGNLDVFVVPARGGPAVRLTSYSTDEVPTAFSPDGQSVYFSAHRLDSRLNAQFPSSRVMPELYRVDVRPGREPELVLTTPALGARPDRAGRRLLYEDLKGYEDLWRKHETFAVAHDVWVCELATNAHRRLTDFPGEDRNPVWAPDEKSVYYLSERGGSSNVWRQPLDPSPGGGGPAAAPEQVTRFDVNPVRFLSISDRGDLCFGYDGEIYLLPAGQTEPRKVPVQVALDDSGAAVETLTLSEGATEMALNPDGKEIAFVARGALFVASTEHGVTKRITDAPGQERSVSFSPDGRRLLFAGETDHAWCLYEASLTRPREEDPYFFAAAAVDVRLLLDNGQENFQPSYSPDGKEVAYLENRTGLRVLNLASKETRPVLAPEHNYSYRDGDQWYRWSPDGKWFLVQFLNPHRWSPEVGLADAAGRQTLVNLTNSGYENRRPRWVQDGRAMVWLSDREGLHGDGLTGESQSDAYALFFTQAAYDRFRLSKADYELAKQAEDEAKKKREPAKTPAEKLRDEESARDPVPRPAEPVALDLNNPEDRVARLTLGSTRIEDVALTPDGEQLLFLSKADKGYELWQQKVREKETKRLAAFEEGPANPRGEHPPVRLELDREGKTAFVLAAGRIAKVSLADGKQEPVRFAAELRLDRSAERAYLFEHIWRQVREKFYVTNLHGVDWDRYKQVYARFLPYLADDRDFSEMASELLGELNASHTGCRYYPPATPGADDTAALGVFFDPDYRGVGRRVAEVIDKGPLTAAKTRVGPNMIVEKLDGTVLAPGLDLSPLLNHKAGQPTLLGVFDPAANARFDVVVKPVTLAEQEELLYQRWVRQRRELVDRLSGGRLGYVHVRAMDDHSYRATYAEILGRQSGKEGLVVDTRFNGGGYLHDDLATLLGGRPYLQLVPRGRVIAQEPIRKWVAKTVLVVGESNYSDAHVFPWTYRALGLGKIVGMPVPGTGTAVWWETLQNPALVFGIPQLGLRDAQGRYLEREQVVPDVVVPNDPESLARGEDHQIEAAVRSLLVVP